MKNLIILLNQATKNKIYPVCTKRKIGNQNLHRSHKSQKYSAHIQMMDTDRMTQIGSKSIHFGLHLTKT